MSSKNKADHVYVREMNLSAVLRRVYDEAPISRAQLASKTGLNKSTISRLVEDLLDRRLIREVGMDSAGAGRPATLLEINARVGALVGVELGVDFVVAAVIDFLGSVLWRKQISTDPGQPQQQTLTQIDGLVQEAQLICRDRGLAVLGLSLAVPGTVDRKAGMLIFAPNLNWRNVPLRELFSEGDVRVYVENDANAAAVGEHLFGGAQQSQNFVFVFAGVGLGGGLFLNGELYRGSGGYAGEIGHTPILAEPYGADCQCGMRGCWETYANQAAVLDRLSAEAAKGGRDGGPMIAPAEAQSAPRTIAGITQAADAGDRQAAEALAAAGRALGIGMAGLINVLNPEKIIVGGPISMAGGHLLPFINESVRAHGLGEIVSQTEISLSAFGPDASVIGAAAVVIDDILQNPKLVEKEVMAGEVLHASEDRV
jgi:glucokinase-like ROK family protein